MDSSRSRLLRLFRANHATLQQNDSTELANVSLTNPSLAVTSSNNLLAIDQDLRMHMAFKVA